MHCVIKITDIYTTVGLIQNTKEWHGRRNRNPVGYHTFAGPFVSNYDACVMSPTSRGRLKRRKAGDCYALAVGV